MRTEEEIREAMRKCDEVADWGISNGPCPFNDDGEEGCCAECSTPSTLRWVLGSNANASKNGQSHLIDVLSNVTENSQKSQGE